MDAELDRILGLDPDPELGAEGRRAIAEGVRRRIADGALDELLELDAELEVPTGLPARVREGVGRRLARPAARRRWVGAACLLAAAAAALLAVRPWAGLPGNPAPAVADGDGPVAADGDAEAPSDELLAALVTLEDLEFLEAELEPIESDALFLLNEEDELLLDLLLDDE